MPTKVAVCQVPEIQMDVNTALQWMKRFTKQAEAESVALVCFPECYLQGYLTDEYLARKHAINLNGATFNILVQQLAVLKSIIVFGLIEEDAGLLYNTAVVIQQGKLLGKYRKTHLLKGEQCFTAGTEYPVFEIGNLKFGINICYDTQFPETTANLARQGATLILCPSNNMMRYETAEKYKHLHHKKRIQRVNENQVWLLSSDITGERDGRICYGPTSAINPEGEVVAQVPLMEIGMVVLTI